MSSRHAGLSRLSPAVLFAILTVPGAPSALAGSEIPWGDPLTVYGDYVSVLAVDVADIDRDGIPDLVASGPDSYDLAWFRNLGNGVFVPKLIASGVVSIDDVEVADLDGDGDPDVVVSAGDTADAVGWFENDGTPLTGAWPLHVIATGFDEAAILAVADFDRDGDLDVAASSPLAAGGSVAVALNADGTATTWSFETVDAAFPVAYWIAAGDVDGDGDVDLAGAARGTEDPLGGIAWWERSVAGGSWTRHLIAWPVPVAAGVALCDFDRDGDLDVAGTSTALISDLVGWWENGDSWSFHQVAAGLGAWTLSAVDLDRDGDCDLTYGALIDDTLGWLENSDGAGGAWTPRTMPGTFEGAFGVTAGDLDRDGDLDLAAAVSGTDDLLIWENRTIHRDALFPELVGLGLGGATRSLAAGDVDGDGDADLLGGANATTDLVWWENQSGGTGWAKWSIASDFSARGAAIADLDDDDLADALAVGPAGFKWWRHNPAGTWTGYAVPTAVDSPAAVLASDLDRDGDLDVVVGAQTGGVSWLENTRDATDFPESDIGTPFLADPKALALGDLDRDGAPDLVVGFVAGVGWYRNQLADGAGFAASVSIAAELDQPRAVALGDLDRDGDLDVAAVEASAGTVSWWANLAGDASAWGPAQPIAAGIDEPRRLVLADFDLDGDLDVAVGAENATTQASLVAWYENGGFGSGWTAHTVATSPLRPNALLAADLDRDGDPDLALGGLAGAPGWFPNRGGQVALATAVTAPVQLPPGVRDDLLAIDLTHLGRPLDAKARALEIALRFTDPALAPLSSEKLGNLLASLSFYVDDGDGLFEPATELLLRTVTAFELVDGVESYPLADATQLEVLAGESCRIFVAVEFAADASEHEPPALHVAHLEALSLVEHRSEGIPLSIEDPQEVATPLIAAVPAGIFADSFESGDFAAWDGRTP